MNIKKNETTIFGLDIKDANNQPFNLAGCTLTIKIVNGSTLVYSGSTSTFVGDADNQIIYTIDKTITSGFNVGNVIIQLSLLDSENHLFYSDKVNAKIEDTL